MKEFSLKDADNVVKKRSNKKLTENKIAKIKETGEVTASDYLEVMQPKKQKDYIGEVEPELAKARNENQLGVPSSFFDLTIKEQSMLMFYLSPDFVHPITNKRTHMNILHSYITAYLDDDEIGKVWEITKSGKIGKIKNYKKYAEVQAKAIEVFNKNPMITEAWNDLVKMTFGAEPETLIKNAILHDALHAEAPADKNANRKMALEILGVNREASNTVNVFLDGGGRELVEVLDSKDNMITTESDLEI